VGLLTLILKTLLPEASAGSGPGGAVLVCGPDGAVPRDGGHRVLLPAEAGGVLRTSCAGFGDGTEEERSCRQELPIPPVGAFYDVCDVSVLIQSSSGGVWDLILQEEIGPCDEGWQVVASDSPGAVVLCPATCGRLEDDAGAKVVLVIPCTVS
jgi:hypothetical protein